MITITKEIATIQTIKVMDDVVHCYPHCEYFAPGYYATRCVRIEEEYVVLKSDGKYFFRTGSCADLFGNGGRK